MECLVTRKECGRIINELNNFQNPTLIPIIMFDTEACELSIEYVWIVNFCQESHIGMSLIYNEKKRRVEIKGIHTDKESILKQHRLIFPIQPLDFEFESKIDELVIS